MATITTPTSIISGTAAVPKTAAAAFSPSPILGLAQMGMRGGKVRCSSDTKEVAQVTTGASLLAAAAVMGTSNPVMALVDERMSTEGTGLSLGVSNNLLGWILLGVFALIWALYFAYTSTLEEDEESGLSL